MSDIKIHERTNQRDGTVFLLQYSGETPLCPHCGARMSKCGSVWENSTCACWWKGQNEANYYAQVVIADSPEGEFNFRTTVDEARVKDKAEREEREMKARLDYAVADREGKFKIIHALRYLWGKSSKKARARVREVIDGGGDFDAAMRA
jgi:hypothetical protein